MSEAQKYLPIEDYALIGNLHTVAFHYNNLGWKDATDAVVYADGTPVQQPKGLCELQGYVYDAKTRMAEVYRPPEVFAGVQREGEMDFPILYPAGANIPQAWATGSTFHMLRTILGLRADAPHKRLYVQPTLPDWLPDIELQHLRVGSCTLSLRFWREGDHSRWEVSEVQADKATAAEDNIQVMDEPEMGK